MQSNECPKCGGLMEMSADRRKMCCPYCMGEFVIDEREEDAFDKKNVIDPLLFDSEWDIESLRSKPNGKDFIDEFLYAVNELCKADAVKENLLKMLSKSTNSDMATQSVHSDLLSTAKAKVSSVLDPGEEVLAYQNTGLFSKGKEGTVLTDKRIITFDTKKTPFELYKDIRSLTLDIGSGIPTVKVNGEFAVRMSMLGSNYRGTGAAAALICLYALAQNPDLKKIKLS